MDSLIDDKCISKLLINLKVIGKIGPNTKVNTKGKYLQLDDTTYWQGALRWYRGDNREIMYDKIHSAIMGSSKLVFLAVNDYNKYPNIPRCIYHDTVPSEFLSILFSILKQVKIGIENLKDTYVMDHTLASRIETDIFSINNQISIIERTTQQQTQQHADITDDSY